ncbi:HTH-type transcriptional regulator CatM [Streptomyces sp. YIM 130001]|uniref:LysR family transcriptional regulator n=1 Tax=Streptomyces sp. YIM 130001 TaxID=2259644 RepID=UPI000E65C58E|nr:LysR family transcriptional regulator [Streptomyces sp. YIM 130001]RII17831.1 HTH-type transcriptional regulator CatM [Streptomyces sp. YIM 130001]
MLDLRRLLVLRSVVTSGSVSAAAASLGYTPSAISQQIAALEKEAGTALLERAGRGVRPTEAGRLLTGYAETLSRTAAEAERSLADLREGRTGRVAVRYFGSAGAALMAPTLALMRRDHPGIRVELAVSDPHDPLPQVKAGRADLALVVAPQEPSYVPAGVRLVPLLEDPYRLVLPPEHRLAGRRTIALAELADEPWVSGERSADPCLALVLTACAAAGFTPDFAVQSGDYAAALGFVTAGLGVALIPAMALRGDRTDVVVREIRGPAPVRSICAALRETSSPPASLCALLDALAQTAASAGGG